MPKFLYEMDPRLQIQNLHFNFFKLLNAFFVDGRLRCAGGHQIDHQAIRSNQQPLSLQHDDDDVTQPQDWIKICKSLWPSTTFASQD